MATMRIDQYAGALFIGVIVDAWVLANNVQGDSTHFVLTSPTSYGTLTTTVQGSGFTYSNGQVTGGIISSVHIDADAGTGSFPVFDVTSTDAGGLHLGLGTLGSAIQAIVANTDFGPFLAILGGYDVSLDASSLTGSDNTTFYSGAGNDVLNGGEGPDLLAGGGGDDSFVGGAGTDTALFTGSRYNYGVDIGAGLIFGPDGIDSYSGIELLQFDDGTLNLLNGRFNGSAPAGRGVTIVGTSGADTLDDVNTVFGQPRATSYNDVIFGGAGNDRIDGQGGNDIVFGGDGNDIVFSLANEGQDFLDGGPGDDLLYASYGGTVRGGEGFDLVNVFSFSESTGGVSFVFNNQIQLAPDAGNGFAEISGFEGILNFRGSQFDDFVDLRGATISGKSGFFSGDISGNSGEDTLVIDDITQTINTLVTSVHYFEYVYGYFQNETAAIHVSSSGIFNDDNSKLSIYMSNILNDFRLFEIYGGSNADTMLLPSTVARAVFYGNGGDDNLRSANADDLLCGGLGSDTLDGGAGIDTAVFSGSRYAYLIDIEAGRIAGPDGTDTFSKIEFFEFDDGTLDLKTGIFSGPAPAGSVSIVGTSGGDVIDSTQAPFAQPLTTAFDDVVYGRGGADIIKGNGGSDQLFGEAGDDTLNGGIGTDILDGGAGIDTAVFSGKRAAYTINFNAGTIIGLDGTDSYTGIEYLKFDDMTLDVARLSNPHSVTDFDGSGQGDLLLKNSSTGYLSYRDGGAPGTFVGVGIIGQQAVMAVGDFNGDGRDDVLLKYLSGWSHYLGGANATDDHGVATLVGQTLLATGDFNGDGKADLLLRYGDGWTHYLGNASAANDHGVGNTGGQTLLGVGDFNGDGHDDLLMQYSGGWVHYLASADSHADHGVTRFTDQTLIGIADFNGDGRDDILLRYSNGWTHYLNGAESTDDHGVANTTGLNIAGIGDFNGDGKDDILLQYSGGWTYYLNGGVKSDVHDLTRLAGKTVISIDDYSGDGADDVLYRDNASGQLAYVTADHPSDAHVFAADPSVSVVNADLGFSTGSDMLIA